MHRTQTQSTRWQVESKNPHRATSSVILEDPPQSQPVIFPLRIRPFLSLATEGHLPVHFTNPNPVIINLPITIAIQKA